MKKYGKLANSFYKYFWNVFTKITIYNFIIIIITIINIVFIMIIFIKNDNINDEKKMTIMIK